MITEHGDDAERRVQVPKRPHVLGDVGLRDVDHVARLHDQIGPESVRQRHDLCHFFFRHVNARVHVGDVSDAESV